MEMIDGKRPCGLRTWIEINTKALEKNYTEFRKVAGNECKIMAVVKSNAYGHCMADYASAMDRFGADWFGVDSVVEAKKLRDIGLVKPILVLGYTLPEHFENAADQEISLTISSFESLDEIAQTDFAKKLKIHLKIDTGMHRQGFCLEDLPKVISRIRRAKMIELEGVYTHFAAAKNPALPMENAKQLKLYNEVIKMIELAGFTPIRHTASSGGLLVSPEGRYDMVRVGLGMMGVWPSAETKSFFSKVVTLTPILGWKSLISEIKNVKEGERVGYNFTEVLRRDSKLAVIPVGYWHGYRWSLSGVGNVLVGGNRCRVIGRVSMDMIVIDVTDLKSVKVGDIVTLLGRDGDEEVSVEEFASLSGSYSYEVLTTLNPLIKRIYK